MSGLTEPLLRAILDSAPQGVVIFSTDDAVRARYLNAVFTSMTGMTLADDPSGSSCGLAGSAQDRESIERIGQAVRRREPSRLVLRSYGAEAVASWCELSLQPLTESGSDSQYVVGFLRDLAGRVPRQDQSGTEPPAWIREDRLTGLASRDFFDEVLRREWAASQRESRPIGLILIDPDYFAGYNEIFASTGADACLRRVARLVQAAYRRGSDLACRWDGCVLAVMLAGAGAEPSTSYVNSVLARIFEQRIHHPRSPLRYVTASAGIAVLVPQRAQEPTVLISAAESALRRAKSAGRNRAEVAGKADFRAG
ncbi:MAG: diguanylate cyclase [Steroidobacteraceae bacterium]